MLTNLKEENGNAFWINGLGGKVPKNVALMIDTQNWGGSPPYRKETRVEKFSERKRKRKCVFSHRRGGVPKKMRVKQQVKLSP